tara:strand:+ start:257 stop:544 length:288 start_codon:yes stop_codon:yes gene_type:complete
MAIPLLGLMTIAALRKLGTKAALGEIKKRGKTNPLGTGIRTVKEKKPSLIPRKNKDLGEQSFFKDKMAIRRANVANDKARKTAAQRLKDKFNKDK